MTHDESLAAAIVEAVALVPYDPMWPRAFDAERQRLRQVMSGEFAVIEHIGSTAIAGLPAKPIIDILIGVESMAHAEALVETLCSNGYTTSKAFNDSLPDRKWLMRWQDGHRTHHVHVVVHAATQWHARLAFRDALRRDASLADRYAALKRHLAEQHRDDREAYTAAKSEFVESTVRKRLPR